MAHDAAINHDFGIIAVFSPKCASSSIKRWLWDARTHNGARPHEGNPWVDFGRIELDTIGDHPGYRTVVFVRDPLRRVVSFYRRFVVLGEAEWIHADDDGTVDLRDCTFRETVAAIADVARSGRRLQHHLVPQVDGIPPGTAFDAVVVVERFDADLAAFNRVVGITSPGPWRSSVQRYHGPDVPAADLSPAAIREHGAPPVERFVDDELAATIAEVYAHDVDWYLSMPETWLLTASARS
jgi:hypothetical protein